MCKFEDFEKMLDAVCSDIMQKNNNNVAVSYSGGMDSTAIVLSLLKTKKKFVCVYARSESDFEKYNIGWEHRFQDFVVEYVTHIFNLPLFMLPINRKNIDISFLNLYRDYGIKTLIISGDGMDRCYSEFNTKKNATFGMDFRAFHPLIDMFVRTLTSRIETYRKTTYEDRFLSDDHKKILMAKQQYNVEFVSTHPLFISFFKKYNENIKDIFFPKMLTQMYVKKNLGMSFNKLCRQVYRLNKSKMKPFFSRLLHTNPHTLDQS